MSPTKKLGVLSLNYMMDFAMTTRILTLATMMVEIVACILKLTQAGMLRPNEWLTSSMTSGVRNASAKNLL